MFQMLRVIKVSTVIHLTKYLVVPTYWHELNIISALKRTQIHLVIFENPFYVSIILIMASFASCATYMLRHNKKFPYSNNQNICCVLQALYKFSYYDFQT